MIATYIHFDLTLSKVSIKIDRLISMTTSIELFNFIFKNALIRRNVRVFASNKVSLEFRFSPFPLNTLQFKEMRREGEGLITSGSDSASRGGRSMVVSSLV